MNIFPYQYIDVLEEMLKADPLKSSQLFPKKRLNSSHVIVYFDSFQSSWKRLLTNAYFSYRKCWKCNDTLSKSRWIQWKFGTMWYWRKIGKKLRHIKSSSEMFIVFHEKEHIDLLPTVNAAKTDLSSWLPILVASEYSIFLFSEAVRW